MQKRISLLLGFFLLLLNYSLAQAQSSSSVSSPDSNITLMGRFPTGYCHDAVPFGDHFAIAGSERGVRILNISNLEHPVAIAGIATGGDVTDIFVSGNYAYLTTDGASGYKLTESFTGGLTIIDLTDPAQPQVKSFYDMQAYCMAITGANHYVYIASVGEITVVDVSDASHPQEVGSIYIGNTAHGLFSDGQYLYVAAQSAGFRIYSLSDPAHPSETGNFQYWAEKVFVSDTLAVVTSQQSGRAIFSVNDPANPVKLSEITTGDYSDGYFDAAFKGSYLYGTGRGSDGAPMVKVFNISDPAAPKFVSAYFDTLNTGSGSTYGEHISIASNYALIAAENSLQIIRLAEDGSVQPLSVYYTQFINGDVQVIGNLAYYTYSIASTNRNGLSIIDISDPANLKEAGYVYLNPSGNVENSISVSGGYAYITQSGVFPDTLQGLHIVNISDPQNPVEVNFMHLKGIRNIVASDGPYVYTDQMTGGDTLLVFDMSDPEAPQFVGQYGIDVWNEGYPSTMFLDTNRLYVGTSTGMLILNRNTPGGLNYVSYYALPDGYFGVRGVKVESDYAYLATQYGLCVVDISNPAQPVTVAKSSGFLGDVDLIGNDIYVANGYQGIFLYNLDGDSLVQNGYYFTDNYGARRLDTDGRYLYAVYEGLMVYRKGWPTGLEIKSSQVPNDFALLQNYPNPFNPTTTIAFYLDRPSKIDLSVYDLQGRKVVTLANGMKPAGHYTVTWKARAISSGIYFCVLKSGAKAMVRRMLLLK